MNKFATLNLELSPLVRIHLGVAKPYNDRIRFKNICPSCHTPIKYKKICPECEEEVEYSNMEKGYEVGDDLIAIDKEKLKEFRSDEPTKVKKVVDLEKAYSVIGTIGTGGYYLLPEEEEKKLYFMLNRYLNQNKKALLVEFSLRRKKYLGFIHTSQNYLILSKVVYPNQVRDSKILRLEEEISEEEYEMLEEQLQKLEEKSKKLSFVDLENDFEKNVKELIEEKLGDLKGEGEESLEEKKEEETKKLKKAMKLKNE